MKTPGKFWRCGKVRWRDHREAVAALHRCQARHALGDHRRQEQRIYECDWCHGWHLTSQPARPLLPLAA